MLLLLLPSLVLKIVLLAYLFFIVQWTSAQEQDDVANSTAEILTKLNELTEKVHTMRASKLSALSDVAEKYISIVESKKEQLQLKIGAFESTFDGKVPLMAYEFRSKKSRLESAMKSTKDKVEAFKREVLNENPDSFSSSKDIERLRLNDQCSFSSDWQDMDHLQFYKAAFMKNTYASPHYDLINKPISYCAVDGDHSTIYHSEKVYAPWWLVDLESDVNIYKIEILPREKCCAERFHDVEVRLGKEENQLQLGRFEPYQLLLFYKGPYSAGDGILVCNFDQGVTGRYLSIQIVNHTEFLQLATVHVYAKRE